MRLKYSKQRRVSMSEAEQRALAVLRPDRLLAASAVGDAIWPDHQMTSQGAGGAASRVLQRLERRGLVRWSSTSQQWGWRRVR